DLGGRLPEVDLQVFQNGDVVDALVGVQRRADAHRGGVNGVGHARAEQVVDAVDDVLGRGEVGAVEVQGQAVALGERGRYCPLHRGTGRDAAAGGHVDGDSRTVAAAGIEAADHQVALGDGVDVAVDALERSQQQAAAAQALGVTDGGHGHVDGLARLGEGGQLGMHRHGGDVLQLHAADVGR